MYGRTALIAALGLGLTTGARAQRADENVVRSSEDAFRQTASKSGSDADLVM
jgi:hypothetical protein